MEIQRIDTYDDTRFHKKILQQHGAFLIDGEHVCEVEIIGANAAVIHYHDVSAYKAIIDEFRFYAEHICCFYNEEGQLIQSFPEKDLFWIDLDKIQPSQFYVDEEKLAAVADFVKEPEDVVIPLNKFEDRYLSCDGHTRMYAAYEKGIGQIKGYLTETNDCLLAFVQEARRRKVFAVSDMEKLRHEEYAIKWHQFCEELFRELKEDAET